MKTWIFSACFLGWMAFATNTQSAVVFALGTFDASHGEFEQEASSNNDSKFYVHAGNYTAVQGVTGLGANVASPEILSDGPLSTDWSKSLQGFRRALVATSGFEKEDVFFQLTQAQAEASSLVFKIRFHQIGSGSNHNLQLTLNGQVFATLTNLTAATGILEYTMDASLFQYTVGGNVIGLNRTGGNNSWIAMDALELHTVPEPTRGVLAFMAGGALLWRRRRR